MYIISQFTTSSNKKFLDILMEDINNFSNELHVNVDIHFSNSLIIHKEKTKEITTVTVVWIPDLD